MEIARIYSQFHDSMLLYIKRRIRSTDDAEDILQDIFVRISHSINRLGDGEKLQAWLFAIARNAIIDYYRRSAVRKGISISEDVIGELSEAETQDSTQGLDQCIRGMISLLPDNYKEIIIDSELNKLRQKDLAAKYNMTYSSLRSRVQRGRERLKQLFYNCCKIEADQRGNILDVEPRSNCDSGCGCPGKVWIAASSSAN